MSPRRRTRRRLLASATGILFAGEARAITTAEVRADSVAQAYQARGYFGATALSLRRYTQTLSMSSATRGDDPRGVVALVRARLRIDSDFGNACDVTTDRCLDEVNTARGAEFSPLFARRSLDLPWAYVDLQNIARGRVEVRVGRQVLVDVLGFALLDGARARARLWGGLWIEALAGLETRSGFPLSNGRYERDGVLRADRSTWDPTLAPHVRDRAMAGMFGAAIDLRALGPLSARLTWRRVQGSEGISDERVGASADLALSRRVRVVGEAAYSLPLATLTSASAALEWVDARGRLAGVELARLRPVFDATSVWASFWIDPTDDLRLHGELPLGASVVLTASALVRRYAIDAGRPQDDGDLWAGGGALGLSARRGRGDLSVRATAEHGSVATRVGGDVGARWWLRPEKLRLDLSTSGWWVEDRLRPERSVFSFAMVAAVLARLGRVAQVGVSLEDDINRVTGHRVRALAVVELAGPF